MLIFQDFSKVCGLSLHLEGRTVCRLSAYFVDIIIQVDRVFTNSTLDIVDLQTQIFYY